MQLLKTILLLLLLQTFNLSLFSQTESKKKNTSQTELNNLPLKLLPPSTLDSLSKLKGVSEYNFRSFLDKSSLYEYNYGSEPKFQFYLPKDTSYYMRRAVLLHMANNKEAKELGAEYVKMFTNVLPEEFRREVSQIFIFSGVRDPVEAYRNYKRRQRQKRVMEIISKLTAVDRKDTIRTDSLPMIKEKAE